MLRSVFTFAGTRYRIIILSKTFTTYFQSIDSENPAIRNWLYLSDAIEMYGLNVHFIDYIEMICKFQPGIEGSKFFVLFRCTFMGT